VSPASPCLVSGCKPRKCGRQYSSTKCGHSTRYPTRALPVHRKFRNDKALNELKSSSIKIRFFLENPFQLTEKNSGPTALHPPYLRPNHDAHAQTASGQVLRSLQSPSVTWRVYPVPVPQHRLTKQGAFAPRPHQQCPRGTRPGASRASRA